MTTPLHLQSASELARRIASKELSPVELIAAYLDRISGLDEHYRAYLHVCETSARAQAEAAEAAVAAGAQLGALHGVPFAAKDLLDTAGVPTTCGSRILQGRLPETTATAVERLVSAGAILLGKLHMTEFAGWWHHPDLPAARNPFDLERSAGGSSSGSGVAVAAGLCAAALGSDTVASIRNPAAWNGCVGFKPTWGRVSRHGVFPLAASLDHVGPMTRTVEDAALLMSVIAGHDPKDPTSLRQRLPDGWPKISRQESLRVGYDEKFVIGHSRPNIARCAAEAVEELADHGATIVPVSIPMTDTSLEPYVAILRSEVRAAHRRYFPKRAADYGQTFRDLLEQAADVSPDALIEANLYRAAFVDAINALFAEVDVLVTPVGPLNATPVGGELRWSPALVDFLRYTYLWNLAGVPALALPWGLDTEDLPNAVQIIGPHGGEELVLSVAAAIERELPIPPIPS